MREDSQTKQSAIKFCVKCKKNVYPDTEIGRDIAQKVIDRTKAFQLHSYFYKYGNGIHLTKRPQ